MKKLFFTTLLILNSTFGIISQTLEIDSTTNRYSHTAILEIDSTNKEILFDRTMGWIADQFKNPDKVISFSDKGANKIVVNGFARAETYSLISVYTHFRMQIDFKDNKVRVSYSEFYTLNAEGIKTDFERSLMKKQQLLIDTRTKVESYNESLKTELSKNENSGTSSDW